MLLRLAMKQLKPVKWFEPDFMSLTQVDLVSDHTMQMGCSIKCQQGMNIIWLYQFYYVPLQGMDNLS